MTERLERALQQSRPFDSLPQGVLVALQAANARAVEPLSRYLRHEAGITPAQYNVLRILRGAGRSGLPCGEIAARMIDRDPDMTRLVDRLVRAGMVVRDRDPADRRVVVVRIAPRGLEVLAETDAEVKAIPARMLGPMGADRLALLLELLEDVIERSGNPTTTNTTTTTTEGVQ